jgi:hypothetical protein
MNSRLPDLSTGRELAIWCVTMVVIVLVSYRTAFVVWRCWHRREHCYPMAWTRRQVVYLEATRISVGAALLLTWAAWLAAAPFLPIRYPFSQSQAVLLIALLIQTYAFLLMVIPQDWNKAPIAGLRFGHLLGGVVLWWVGFLGITLYMMAKLAGPRILQRPELVTGAFA